MWCLMRYVPPPLSPSDRVEGEWTGERELTLRPGYQAYIVPEPSSNTSCTGPTSCITLADGGVRTEAFAVLFSSGSTPVEAPANPPAVSAVLIAPQVKQSRHSMHRFGSRLIAYSNDIATTGHSRVLILGRGAAAGDEGISAVWSTVRRNCTPCRCDRKNNCAWLYQHLFLLENVPDRRSLWEPTP